MAEEKRKSRELRECYTLLNKIKKHIENNDTGNAKKLYVRCRKLYTKLSEEDKKEIYNKIEVIYEELSS